MTIALAPVLVPALVVGTAADIAIAKHISRDGMASRGWSTTGDLCWGLSTIAAGVLLVYKINLNKGGRARTETYLPLGVSYLVFSGGSLALSVYGSFHPMQPKRVSLIPALLPHDSHVVPGLLLSIRG